MRKFNRIGCVLNIWLHLQNFHEPVKTGNSFLIEPGEITESLDWFNQNTNTQ